MNSLYHLARHTAKTKSHRVCRYHGMMLRILSSLVAPHAMKFLPSFLALFIICFLYHHSLNEAAIMATGKWCFRADATSKYSGGRGARRRHSSNKQATHIFHEYGSKVHVPRPFNQNVFYYVSDNGRMNAN
jgi:hypothetical protein